MKHLIEVITLVTMLAFPVAVIYEVVQDLPPAGCHTDSECEGVDA